MKENPTADKLIEVAGEIFAEKGNSATVREICKVAECSIAAISYHFGDKHQLYVRCVEAACQRKQRLFPFPDLDDGRSGPELLRDFLRAVTARIGSTANLPWQNTLMLREMLTPTPEVSSRMQGYIQADMEKLGRLLSQIIGPELDNGPLRHSLLTQILARCMFLRVGKTMRGMVGLDFEANEDPEQYADGICESILLQINALRNQKTLGPVELPDLSVPVLSIPRLDTSEGAGLKPGS